MKPIINFSLLLVIVFTAAVITSQPLFAQEKPLTLNPILPTYSKVYDDQRDPFVDAKAALSLANASNRQVLIEIGGNWCTWCYKMNQFLINNPDVYQALHSKYVVLKVNVSDSNDNEAFMKSLPPVMGYPHMFISTARGKMILSKDTAELLDGDQYSVQQWLRFIDDWSVTTLAMQNQ